MLDILTVDQNHEKRLE